MFRRFVQPTYQEFVLFFHTSSREELMIPKMRNLRNPTGIESSNWGAFPVYRRENVWAACEAESEL
jgi:hypothetical protein